MGNKLNLIMNRKDQKAKETNIDPLDSLPTIPCVTDNLPVESTENNNNNNIPTELKTSNQFEEYFQQTIKQCISSKSNNIALIAKNMSSSYMPLFNFPFTLFKQCSLNLVELSIAWSPLPPTNDNNYSDSRENPSKIINSFPSNIFNYLPNLQTLNLARYPFPYISDKIGNLINLQTLYCYGSQIICFPRT
eukprot:10300_1